MNRKLIKFAIQQGLYISAVIVALHLISYIVMVAVAVLVVKIK
jgi:hypothetical protein